jgi:hypothetical protein
MMFRYCLPRKGYDLGELMGSVNEAVFGVGEGEGTRATKVEKKFSVFGSGAHLMSRPWLKYIGELIFGRLC